MSVNKVLNNLVWFSLLVCLSLVAVSLAQEIMSKGELFRLQTEATRLQIDVKKLELQLLRNKDNEN